MDAGNEWLIQNQQTVRSANERLSTLAVEVVPAGQFVPFICECADGACLGRVDMKVAEYEDVHRDRDQYSVIRAHQVVDGEKVVEQRQLFDIVSKAALSG